MRNASRHKLAYSYSFSHQVFFPTTDATTNPFRSRVSSSAASHEHATRSCECWNSPSTRLIGPVYYFHSHLTGGTSDTSTEGCSRMTELRRFRRSSRCWNNDLEDHRKDFLSRASKSTPWKSRWTSVFPCYNSRLQQRMASQPSLPPLDRSSSHAIYRPPSVWTTCKTHLVCMSLSFCSVSPLVA